MATEFNIPFVLHGDALVMLMSQVFQLTLAEARSYFNKPRKNVEYCGYSTNHQWRPVSLDEGVPLEGGYLKFGLRQLTLPERLVRVKVKHDALRDYQIAATVVEMCDDGVVAKVKRAR